MKSYLWIFAPSDGTDQFPLFWSNEKPTFTNDPNLYQKERIIELVERHYDRNNKIFLGEIYAYHKLNLLDVL